MLRKFLVPNICLNEIMKDIREFNVANILG